MSSVNVCEGCKSSDLINAGRREGYDQKGVPV